LAREFVHPQDVLIVDALILAHGVVERATTSEDLVQCHRTLFGVAKGIADPLRRDRVFVVARVTDECPECLVAVEGIGAE
jgi:hypothetical protein